MWTKAGVKKVCCMTACLKIWVVGLYLPLCFIQKCQHTSLFNLIQLFCSNLFVAIHFVAIFFWSIVSMFTRIQSEYLTRTCSTHFKRKKNGQLLVLLFQSAVWLICCTAVQKKKKKLFPMFSQTWILPKPIWRNVEEVQLSLSLNRSHWILYYFDGRT